MDRRRFEAYLDADGNLHLEGQDLGPGTGPLGADGEYEWFLTIRAADVPALRDMLGIHADADLLETLERSWSGPTRSRDLEARIHASGIETELDTWRS